MTTESSNAPRPVNELDSGTVGETSTSHAPESEFLPKGARKPRRPATLAEKVAGRRWRRRNDISTLDGLIREHGKVISAIHSGKLPLEKGEILSRAYGRHREMVAALEQRQQLQSIQEQLARLTGKPLDSLQISPASDSPEQT
jgi:hypothetical protein